MSRPEPARRPSSPCGCGPQARGTCPHATVCPRCHAAPGTRCKRPSGHPAGEMHAERYRASERADAASCPGFEPIESPAGTGCRHCSGLPEDHAAVTAEARPAHSARERPAAPSQASGDVQGTLF
jgi:hypothetical protein